MPPQSELPIHSLSCTKHLHSFILFSVLATLTSCTGQNTAEGIKNPSTSSLGDTVSKLSESIWIVFQAANGDYWFGSGTDDAYHFDGKTIVQFTESDGLSSNRIRGIQEDH